MDGLDKEECDLEYKNDNDDDVRDVEHENNNTSLSDANSTGMVAPPIDPYRITYDDDVQSDCDSELNQDPGVNSDTETTPGGISERAIDVGPSPLQRRYSSVCLRFTQLSYYLMQLLNL